MAEDSKTNQKQSTKTCTKCKEVLTLDLFYKNSTAKDGLSYWCKDCCKTHSDQKRSTVKHKEYIREYHLKRKYNMTLKEYMDILMDQSECCAICFEHESTFKKPLVVDHNHSTGAVRGLICDYCNTGLGRFHDNPDNLRSAADYLESRGYYG